MATTRIERREDVSPMEGLREYGAVQFADPANKKYPIDTAEHVRAAWSHIDYKDNTSEYDADEVGASKDRIKRAAKNHGVDIESD